MERDYIRLGVNIDHCATLRQARYRQNPRACGREVEPDPVLLAQLAQKAGADGITAHLREDRRHIVDSDIRRLRETIMVPLNMEMACTEEMTRIAGEVMPDHVCIVPENRAEVTTEGGLNVSGRLREVNTTVQALGDKGIVVSLFIDPDPEQIEAAGEVGAPVIELHTGAYANSYYTPKRRAEFRRLVEAAELAHQTGLRVHAGHGINYVNIKEIRNIPWLEELNIGHSILSRALYSGIEEAVREMRGLMNVGG